ncbi:MAG: hypothetical protein WAV46_02930 [Candidatus Moraniibacteriota bacterium]
MNKNLLTTILSLAIAAALAPATASAAPTTVTSTWNGSGTITFDAVAAGSTHANVQTGGFAVAGTASFLNNNDNPYGYGVDTTKLDVNASVTGGGGIQVVNNRIGSYVPMYGASGQSISAIAQSSDGTAALVQHSTVNYASMNDVGYGQAHTTGGNTMDASGSAFSLGYTVNTGTANNVSGFNASGSGTGAVILASSGASANSFKMGNGQGIYTQANYTANGIGSFAYGGSATNSLTVLGANNTLPGTVGNPATVTISANYAGALTWTNFAIAGNK